MNILFLCTGNLCRSPMAEVFLRDLLPPGGVGAKVKVTSAGIDARDGEPPPPEVLEVMGEMGYDLSGHRSRALDERQVREADLILTMAMHNSSRLLTLHQEAVDRVFTLKEFVIQGKSKDDWLRADDPEKRLRELKKWIRHVEGLEAGPGEGNLDQKLRLFMLHYFHIYDHRFSIDDPLGQSVEFLRRTADEIKYFVGELAGPTLLRLTGD